jgi:carbamoyltransferase
VIWSHDESFPRDSLRYVLEAGRVQPGSLDLVVFYEKPLTKFVRILESHLAAAPRTLSSFLRAIPSWTSRKLWIPMFIERELMGFGHSNLKLGYTEHHEAHAASAFFPSPFKEAAILTMDGVGEWATTTIGHGTENKVRLLSEIRFPHSLGLLYSAVTQFTGFRVNSGEYKLMGLAPYGKPRYADKIRKYLIDIRPDGSFRMDQRYFHYVGGLSMINDRFASLFDGPPRQPESAITQRDMDLACSIQDVTEEIVVKLGRTAALRTGSRRLCMAGGVALNCVANAALARARLFDEIWIQPAAGDAGGAIGGYQSL